MSGKERTVAGAVTTCVLFGLVACYSTFPLGPPNGGVIDPRLVGSWRCVSADDSAETPFFTLRILTFDEKQYLLHMAGKKDDEVQDFRAYSTDVSGTPLLNVQFLGWKTEKTWAFVRYALPRDKVLHVTWVRDERMSDVEDTPKARLAFITKHLNEADLYEDYCACVKAKEKEQ